MKVIKYPTPVVTAEDLPLGVIGRIVEGKEEDMSDYYKERLGKLVQKADIRSLLILGEDSKFYFATEDGDTSIEIMIEILPDGTTLQI